MVPIATTTSFVQNGHWSSPDWISSVVLNNIYLSLNFMEIFVFRIINACTMYMFFWWRQFRLLTNNSGCYAKEFLRKRLLLRLTRCVWQIYIYVMVAGRELEDIVRTDTICPPRSSLYSGGAIDDGIDGTCVLSNPLYTNTYLVTQSQSPSLSTWTSSSQTWTFQSMSPQLVSSPVY